jgi:hypothetical protein
MLDQVAALRLSGERYVKVQVSILYVYEAILYRDGDATGGLSYAGNRRLRL